MDLVDIFNRHKYNISLETLSKIYNVNKIDLRKLYFQPYKINVSYDVDLYDGSDSWKYNYNLFSGSLLIHSINENDMSKKSLHLYDLNNKHVFQFNSNRYEYFLYNKKHKTFIYSKGEYLGCF